MDFHTHPRGHVVKPDGQDRHGKPRYKTQVKNVKVGDVLAGFGKVLQWQETEPQKGWRMFRMVTEHPVEWPTRTNIHSMPEYMYYGITSLAD
ncbi:hypothetical protein [Actinacidiphila soli]|uniref:hypothetical protein n=1 Tax=Actinacidiphila soli TaxID=2487275 RepID=UPI000FCC871B|nr:hypothetical protein [Actinacidiphila soli]